MGVRGCSAWASRSRWGRKRSSFAVSGWTASGTISAKRRAGSSTTATGAGGSRSSTSCAARSTASRAGPGRYWDRRRSLRAGRDGGTFWRMKPDDRVAADALRRLRDKQVKVREFEALCDKHGVEDPAKWGLVRWVEANL